jgi:hypothetical protein
MISEESLVLVKEYKETYYMMMEYTVCGQEMLVCHLIMEGLLVKMFMVLIPSSSTKMLQVHGLEFSLKLQLLKTGMLKMISQPVKSM